MAKRKYSKKSSRKRSFTIPLAPVGGLIAMPAVKALIGDIMNGNIDAIPSRLGLFAGVNENGQFSISTLLEEYTPPFAGLAVHWGASKFGINRMLARAGVPIVRI